MTLQRIEGECTYEGWTKIMEGCLMLNIEKRKHKEYDALCILHSFTRYTEALRYCKYPLKGTVETVK